MQIKVTIKFPVDAWINFICICRSCEENFDEQLTLENGWSKGAKRFCYSKCEICGLDKLIRFYHEFKNKSKA